MGELFRAPSKPHRSGPIFVKAPPNRIVVPLCDPSGYQVCDLHWQEGNNGSIICTGEDCPLCPGYRFQFTYAPGLVWSSRVGRWMDGILCFGHPHGTLAQEAFTGQAIVFGKSKEAKEEKGRIIYLGQARDLQAPPPPQKKAFDIRPHLLRRWGMFKEADLIDCEMHMPNPMLPFDEQERAG